MKDILKKGQTAAGLATLATVALALLKAVVGYLSGSVLLLADAAHSGVDILAIFASWFGLKISRRPANEKFPYGYYKAESIAALVAVGFIFYAAYEIFLNSYKKFFVLTDLNFPVIALAVPLVSAAISFIIARYEKRVGEEINSQSLLANAQESKVDIYSSLLVFGGILLAYYRIAYVEGIIGILLSLFILKIGYQNAKIALLSLMDASPDIKLENNIKKLILNIRGAKDVKHIKLRQSGAFIFGEARLKVSKNINVKRAHDLSEMIELEIKKRFPHVESFLIHIEPYKAASETVLIPIKDSNGLNSEVVDHFGRANYFLSGVIKNAKIESWRIRENPFIKKEIRAGLAAVKYVMEDKIDAITLLKVGEISFHALRDNYVDIYLTRGRTAQEVLKNYINKKLPKLDQPTHTSDKND